MSSIEQYGRFIDDEGCFELTNEPPRKWVNLHYNKIGDDEIYAEITNIGDGPIWARDKDGVTCQLISYDHKYLYIRDEETGKVFAPWGDPGVEPVENRSCKYYKAKTLISGTHDGIKATQRVFVPKDYVAEAWTVTLENTTDKPKKMNIFTFALFQLTGKDKEGGGIGKDNYGQVLPDIGGVLITNRNTFCPTNKFKGYSITLNKLKGANAYRDHFTRSDFSYSTPKILWGFNCDNRDGYGPDCAAILQVEVEIPAGQTKRADFLIGQTCCADEVKRIRNEITPEKLDQMCEEQEKIEEERSKKFWVKTGNANYDSLMNHFVKKQMYSYLINKSGFRDNMQVDIPLSMCEYQVAEDNVVRALASQYESGSVPHGFRPLNRLQYADKPAWMLMTIPELLKEKGDLTLLEKEIPFFESGDKASVLEHMKRAMRFLANDTGKNGLCDQHHADWNDGLEATKEAGERESVMVSQQLCYGALRMAEIGERIGDSALEKEATEIYETFKKRINEVAWDGEWFVRTICGDGYRIGSKDNKDGKIFMNTQSFAILSEIANEERAKMCLASVDKHIKKDIGFQICSPPYSEYDPRVGTMSNSYVGRAENGGCYNHGAGFKAVADCMMGRAEEAWETFVKVVPDNPENPVSRSEAEPFSFNNFYTTVPFIYGQSGYPWRTGTAGWFTTLLIEWILGARRSYEGLLIDPCLTKTIQHAEVKRTFRGAVFNINLDNSAGRCKGVTSIKLDGQKIEGNILPDIREGEHTVEVVI